MTLRAGDRLGAYEILSPLGSGGMGEVWKARDTRLKREVAVKVLPDALAADPSARARFDREARAVAALSHPNILDVHDVGSEGGVSWIVTELLEGMTVKEKLDGGTAIPWRRAVEVALALAQGVAAAHARGIIHRDLKPSNVFLTSDGRVKILDFGIATLDESGVNAPEPGLTAPHGIVGTAGYLSPEQIRRERADARSDIFALGCVLYEMTTGRRAFPGETPPEAFVATLRSEPKDPADLVPGLPSELRLLILRCVEKSPDRRFQTAADLAFALRLPFEASPTGSAVSASDPTYALPAAAPGAPSAAPPRRRLRFGWLAAAAAVFAAAAWLLVHRRMPALDSLAVLPFENETRDAANDYLSEGVTCSLIDALSQTPALSVKARATVYNYTGNKEPRAAGRELGAKAILIGRVQRQGRDVVVDAELVNVATGARLWHGRVTDHAGDSVPAAADLAPKIARVLRPSLTSDEEKRVAGRPHDPEAWDRVQRGRFFLNKRTPEGFAKALEYFEEAAKIEPREAEAFRGLAEAHHLMAYYGFAPVPPATLVPKLREFAEKSIVLDPSLSGPHAILADALYMYDHDWPAAEAEFRRARTLNPNDALSLQWYSNFLTASRRFDEAFAQISRARALDPLNSTIQMDAGLARYWSGDLAQGEAGIRSAIELDARNPLPRLFIALPLLKAGRPEDALAELKKLREMEPGDPFAVAFYGHACARLGRAPDADAARRELDALAKERYVGSFPFAIVALGQKRYAETLDRLETAAAEREAMLTYLEVEPAFDPLRKEPRFEAVVRRVGIPARR